MKRKLPYLLTAICLLYGLFALINSNSASRPKVERKVITVSQKEKKKTMEERALFDEARVLHEYYRQVNPLTGEVSLDDKLEEKSQSESAGLAIYNSDSRTPFATYIERGPGNLGGRTRALAVDISDNSGNTLLAGGVSGGVFRTTNGGASWTKVSSNDEIHNVTALAQDPRPGFQNIWYYGTGELSGNSASLGGAFYLGQGIWQSTDGGLTWAQMPTTASDQTTFDNVFDIVHALQVHPVTGELYAAVLGQILRFDGTNWNNEISDTMITGNELTDIEITSSGNVYAAFSGNTDATIEGVWRSNTGVGGWTRISNGTFTPAGRVVLGAAPSNNNIIYALFVNGASFPNIESDLYRWNNGTSSWTNYSSKLPDEPGGSQGNDPFAVQGGYDLVVSVKPDDQDFVVIGGTNVYKIGDIITDSEFDRIGGYDSASSYALWNNGGGSEHHPDIHALIFNPFNTNTLFSGTDGGVHRTDNIVSTTAANTPWVNLNNDYQTYQYYHVTIDPQNGSDIIIGGAQDNGTTGGGTALGQPDLTTMSSVFGGDGVAVGISRDNACVPFFFGSQGGNLIRDCPTGAVITPTGSSSQFVTYFYLDPDNNNALYYAGQNTLYRTTNSTTVTSGTWTNLGTTASQGDADFFQTFSTSRGTYNPATSYLLLGGDEGHIYRLDDPQNAANFSSAIDITPPGATLAFPSIVTGLATHPTNRNIVLATYANYGTQSIFLTTNATAATPTWTLVERNLSAHSIRSAAIVETAGETLYVVGTARGLYSSTDPTTTDWSREAPNQIGFALVSSLSYRPSDNKLLIGTHGNGIYEATIDNTTLSIKDNDLSNQIALFPNPANNVLNIKTPSGSNSQSYFQIYNMLGQVVSSGQLVDSIDISNLTSGTYFIELSIDDRKGIKQFIKK